MSSNEQVADVLKVVAKTVEAPDPKKLSLDSLILLVNKHRLNYLRDQSIKEFKTLKERQEQVAKLHKLLKLINSNTNSKGEFDFTKDPEIRMLMDETRKVVDIKEGKTAFNKEERDRLIDNVRMTVEDLNVQNDMQLQTITRLTNERYESYQLARAILKPLHDDKISKARAMSGR